MDGNPIDDFESQSERSPSPSLATGLRPERARNVSQCPSQRTQRRRTSSWQPSIGHVCSASSSAAATAMPRGSSVGSLAAAGSSVLAAFGWGKGNLLSASSLASGGSSAAADVRSGGSTRMSTGLSAAAFRQGLALLPGSLAGGGLSVAANFGSGLSSRPSTGLSAAAAGQGLASLPDSLAGGGLSAAADVGTGGSSRLLAGALEVGGSAAAAVSAEGRCSRTSASTEAAGFLLSDGGAGRAAAVEAPFLQSVEGGGGSPSPVGGTVSGRGPRSKAVLKLRADATTPANVLCLLEDWDAMPARERERVWRRVEKRRRTLRSRFPQATWSVLVGRQSPFKGRRRQKRTSEDKSGDSPGGRELVGIAGDGGGGAAGGGAGRADGDGVAADGGAGHGGDAAHVAGVKGGAGDAAADDGGGHGDGREEGDAGDGAVRADGDAIAARGDACRGGDGVRGGRTLAGCEAGRADGGPCDDGQVAGAGAVVQGARSPLPAQWEIALALAH